MGIIERLGTEGPRHSNIVKYNGVVYLVGLTDDTGGDAKEQAERILEKADALLRQAGTDKSRILTGMVCPVLQARARAASGAERRRAGLGQGHQDGLCADERGVDQVPPPSPLSPRPSIRATQHQPSAPGEDDQRRPC